jgi:hypothetical protein
MGMQFQNLATQSKPNKWGNFFYVNRRSAIINPNICFKKYWYVYKNTIIEIILALI